jgi:Tfp pilus assembly protein PilN
VLIEGLRREQKGPVHMLDEISKALPPMVWLTELKQVVGDVVIDGTSTTQTGVSDFVNNLEASGYFKRSIDIVSTRAVSSPQPPGELVSFTLRAQFLTPGEAKPVAAK